MFIFNPELLLIGVISIWHGFLIFIVSLIAIFAFTSAAQGWLLTRLRWYEIIALLLVTVSMFRPDFIMNRVFPEYISYDQDLNKSIQYDEQRKLRLHVTRYTDYGERYKMFAFPIDSNTKASVLEISGLELERNDNNNFEVVNLTFMGPAEQKGMDFYDEVTRIEVSSLDRPAKEYVYLIGLFVLLLILYSQRRRLSKNH